VDIDAFELERDIEDYIASGQPIGNYIEELTKQAERKIRQAVEDQLGRSA
jgi:hypothetical protein